MSRREKRPTKKDRRAAALARLPLLPKLSETMLRFAKPLFDTFSTRPLPEELDTLMDIATITWNLPICEQRKAPNVAKYRAVLESVLVDAPPVVVEAISEMLRARVTTYGADPRLAVAQIDDNGDGRLRVTAGSVRFGP